MRPSRERSHKLAVWRANAWVRAAAMGFALLLPVCVRACANCMGAKDAPIAPAVNASILLLLIVLMTVAGCFLRFLFYLARRDGVGLSSDDLPEEASRVPEAI